MESAAVDKNINFSSSLYTCFILGCTFMPCHWIGVTDEQDPEEHLPTLVTVSQLCPASPVYLSVWSVF